MRKCKMRLCVCVMSVVVVLMRYNSSVEMLVAEVLALETTRRAHIVEGWNETTGWKKTSFWSKTDNNIFDPALTISDYKCQQNPSRPSAEWITSCAKTLSEDKALQQPFDVKWPMYRLGDCIRFCTACIPFNDTLENNTLAAWYGKLSCHSFINRTRRQDGSFDLTHQKDLEDYEVLAEIFHRLRSRQGFVKPDPNALVIHLRLGDVVENTQLSAEQLLLEGAKAAHPSLRKTHIKTIHSVDTFLDIIDNFTKAQALQQPTRVHIVGGSHKASAYKVSKVYSHCLQRGLAKTGVHVDMWIDEGHTADQDYYYLANAKHLVPSTGGFSRTIARLAQRLGGELLGPDTSNPLMEQNFLEAQQKRKDATETKMMPRTTVLNKR